MIEAYPLYWPEGRPRTETFDRVRSQFTGTFERIRRELCDEIDRMGGINVVISSNIRLRADGMPRAGVHRIDDPGIAVYFSYDTKDMCFACDKYQLTWENMRAIAKTIEAIRGIERWGSSDMMERAFRGFTALPEHAGEYWRHIFGFATDQKVTAEDVEREFKRLAHVAHPDKGGTVEQWTQLCLARENARKDLGVTR